MIWNGQSTTVMSSSSLPQPLALPLAIQPEDQVFVHRDRADTIRCFHIPSLIEAVHRQYTLCRPAHMPLDLGILMYAISQGVISYHGLRFIAPSQLSQPILICEIGPDVVLADGCYRLCRAAQMARPTMPALFIPEAVWRQSLHPPGRLAKRLGLSFKELADNDTARWTKLKKRHHRTRSAIFAARGILWAEARPLRRPLQIKVMTADGEWRDLVVPPHFEYDRPDQPSLSSGI